MFLCNQHQSALHHRTLEAFSICSQRQELNFFLSMHCIDGLRRHKNEKDLNLLEEGLRMKINTESETSFNRLQQ